MANLVRCHGTYIHDLGDVVRVCTISAEEATEMVRHSPWVQPDPLPTADAGPFLNKGWVITDVSGDRAVLVYNSDGAFSVWLGNRAVLATKTGLPLGSPA